MKDTVNIVKCYGVKKVRNETSDVYYILMEYMEQGSLFDLMERQQVERFAEEKVIEIFRQICEGVRTMHHMNPPLCHRDLKIENILYDGKNFKLCDFGSVSSEVIDFK